MESRGPERAAPGFLASFSRPDSCPTGFSFRPEGFETGFSLYTLSVAIAMTNLSGLLAQRRNNEEIEGAACLNTTHFQPRGLQEF